MKGSLHLHLLSSRIDVTWREIAPCMEKLGRHVGLVSKATLCAHFKKMNGGTIPREVLDAVFSAFAQKSYIDEQDTAWFSLFGIKPLPLARLSSLACRTPVPLKGVEDAGLIFSSLYSAYRPTLGAFVAYIKDNGFVVRKGAIHPLKEAPQNGSVRLSSELIMIDALKDNGGRMSLPDLVEECERKA